MKYAWAVIAALCLVSTVALARDYDPTTSRYIEADPIGLDGSSPPSMNVYGYADQNPVTHIDPTGQNAITLPIELCVRNPAACAATATATAAAVGQLVNNMSPGAPAPSVPSDQAPATPQQCPSQNSCPPCSPPRGTQCYEDADYGRPHAGLSPHYHIAQMNQYPYPDCTCVWQSAGGKVGVGVLAEPSAGMEPCSSYGDYQGR